MRKLTNVQAYGILILVLALGLVVRMYKINDHGIWTDEKTSIRSAVGIKDFTHIYTQEIYDHIPAGELKLKDTELNQRPFTSGDYWEKNTLHNVKNAIVLDNSNSLSYAVLLHYWVDWFGTTDVAARMFSVLFGLLTLVLAFYFGRRFLGNDIYALLFVLVLVLNCWLVLNCQLVRAYAFTAFFSFLSTVLFLNILFKCRGGWLFPLYAFAALMALFGHHMTLYIFAAHGLIALLFLRDKKTWLNLVFTAVPVLVLYGLWVTKFGAAGFEILKWKNEELAIRAAQYPDAKFPGAATPKNILGGCVNYLNMIFGTHLLYFGMRIFMVMAKLLIPFALIAIIYLKGADKSLKRIITSVMIIVVAAPLFSAFMAFRSHTAVPFTIFYAAYAVPLGAFLIVLAISRISYLQGIYKYLSMALASVQVILILVSFKTVYKEVMVNAPTPNPYMTIANTVKAQYKAGDMVLYGKWDDAELTNLYLRDRNDIKQNVDSTLLDKVVLGKDGQQILIFDFESKKCRY